MTTTDLTDDTELNTAEAEDLVEGTEELIDVESVDDAEHFDLDPLALDNSAWDGGAAMSKCADSSTPGSCYSSICAGRRAGDPAKQSTWALPHHKTAGGPANANGVRNALARLSSTQGLTNAGAAKAHLQRHLGSQADALYDEAHDHAHEFLIDTADGTDLNTWSGVIAVEGITTGDGREFAPNALTWGELPIPLRWNKEDSHGGQPHTVAVNVGRIDNIWRDGEKIMGSGTFNLDEVDGKRARDLVKGEYMNGISIDADDISDADVELIWPEKGASEEEAEGDGPDLFEMLFGEPEKVIFHAGRIRAATLCDIPAFIEAKIALTPIEELAVAAGGAVRVHESETLDGTWDGAANEARLPDLVPIDAARATYAWIDPDAVEDGVISKEDADFIHHGVAVNGVPGAANLTACAAGIGALNSGRGSRTPSADRRGVYNHLADHLRAAGRTPPPLVADTLTAAAVIDLTEAPDVAWFTNPRFSVPTPLIVSEDGRVYGHAALWASCHIGHPDVCVTPPHEDSHPYFMTGELTCADGSRVSVGQITLGTRHAPLTLNPSAATDHYDNTGVAIADVVVGNDEHGIWVAGAVRPNSSPERVRELRASGQLSGDWRRIGGKLRLVGLLAVNVPGFPIPRLASRVASGQQLALVAAGARSFDRGGPPEDGTQLALRRILERVADKLKKE